MIMLSELKRHWLTFLGNRLGRLVGLILFVGASCKVAPNAEAQTPYPIMRQLAEQASDLEHNYTGGRYVDHAFRYRLFTPQPFDESKSYPLIIWLHGLGDRGTDNLSHLNSFDDTLFKNGVEGAQFFVLALQCPPDNRGGLWYADKLGLEAERTVGKGDDMLAVMLDILNSVQHKFSVDKDAITVVGISSGGSACWELLRREPHRFAGISVHSAGGGQWSDLSHLTHTPIWAFHNVRDETIPIRSIRKTIAAIQSTEEGRAALTEHNAGGHDSWRRAFSEYDLLHWLLAQHKSRGGAPLPGAYSWTAWFNGWNGKAWPKLVSVGAGLATVWICWQQLRSQQRTRPRQMPADLCL